MRIHFGKPISFNDYFDKDIDKKMMYKLARIVKENVKETIQIYRKDISIKNPYGKKM